MRTVCFVYSDEFTRNWKEADDVAVELIIAHIMTDLGIALRNRCLFLGAMVRLKL